MKNLGRWESIVFTAVSVVIFSAVALADPPSRVARLQYMTGDVSVQPGGVNDWVAGVINRPLTTADRLWTEKNARAELHLGSAAMRVSAETSLTLTNLTDQTVQVELDQGTLNLRVRHLYRGEIYEIDTPNMAFTLTKSGEYRFDVDPNGDTSVVTVWRGEGEATGQGRAVKVKRDHLARFTGGTSLAHRIYDDPRPDGFDDWCRVRDQREDHSYSARYVSPYVIGAEDLDDYGTWRTVSSYGPIWVPAVAPGWAPYHYGHWVWVEPWGWTWVDDAPWGFAPCHYGRWVYYSGYWAWVPGPIAVRPIYAPALVAWIGGSHFGIGLSFGSGVGWFPLGYGEPYLPPYAVSRNYFQNVNVNNTHITNITNITNNYYNNTTNINSNNKTTNITNVNNSTNIANNTTINGNHNNVHIKYVNQTVPGAVTAVPEKVLTSSQPVARSAILVPANEMKLAPVASAPPVAPSKNSVLGMNSGAPASVPPAQAAWRPVFSKLAPPPKPVPFAAKRDALAINPGRPLDHGVEEQIRIDVARHAIKLQDEPASKVPPTVTAAEPKSLPVPAKTAEVSQPASSTPVHNVPRPPVQARVFNSPAAISVETNNPHQPEAKLVPTAEIPRAHVVPRPPEKVPVAKAPVAISVETNDPHQPEAKLGPTPEIPREPTHVVPRPPVTPVIRIPARTAVATEPTHQPEEKSGTDAGTPQAQNHAVPRPPSHGVNSASSLPPTTDSSSSEPRSAPRTDERPVSQPPSNSTAPAHEVPRPETGASRRPEIPPASTREESPVGRPQPSAPPAPHPYEGGGARPNVEPRNAEPRNAEPRSVEPRSVEPRNDRPTPPSQSAPSGAAGAPPQAPPSAPPAHADEQRSAPREQPH